MFLFVLILIFFEVGWVGSLGICMILLVIGMRKLVLVVILILWIVMIKFFGWFSSLGLFDKDFCVLVI